MMPGAKFYKFIRIIMLLVLTSIIFYFYEQTYRLYEQHGNTAISKPNEQPAAVHFQSIPESKIKSWNLFGKPTSVDAIIPIMHPQSLSQNLKLTSVFYNVFDDKASVLITKPDGHEEIYKPGDKIDPGIYLKSVDAKSVILTQDGSPWRLIFDDSSSAQETQIEKSFSEEQEGYVVPEDADDLKARYGLLGGDIIISANGYPLTNEADAAVALATFNAVGYVNFVIRRDGETFTLTVKN